MTEKHLFSWRHAILASDLPPTTRHVLLTLSCHMNDVGESCFPATKTLAKETGLSERAVITHLHKSKDAGWLKIGLHGFGGQKWRSHEYTVAIPKGTERGSAAIAEGAEPHAEGAEPDDEKVLNEVQSNSTVNSTENSTVSGSDEPGAAAPPTDLFGGKPPPKQPDTLTEDARSQMWRMGVSLLTNQGLAESTARGLIGKWAKQGEKKLAGVIGECAVKPPADARAYINAAMQNAYNLYDEKQLQAAAKAYGVKIKQKDSWDSLRQRVQDAMRGGVAA